MKLISDICRIITWLKCKFNRHEYVRHNTDKEFVGWGFKWDVIGVCKHCGDTYRVNQFIKTIDFYDVYHRKQKNKLDGDATTKEDRVGGVYGMIHSFYR